MRRNKLGATGLDVSIIGLGLEHLQFKEADKVVPVVHRAIEGGINYFDLLVGSPEVKDVFALALKGHRDDLVLAAHLGIAETDGQYRKSRDVGECEEIFYDLLSRLDTDHVDVLHLHNVDEEEDYQQIVGPGGVLELALDLKQKGKTGCISFSGHNIELAKKAVRDGHIDVLMHPVNIAWDATPGRKELFHLCASRGVGLVGMKPFGGGEIFQREKPISPVKCINYTLSQAGVSLALMGVKNIQELEANLAFLDATEKELDFAGVLAEFQGELEGTCVYCNHCLPCPSIIDIGSTIRLSVTAQHGVTDQLRADYDALAVKASACIECDECTERCPFGVDVIARMRQTVELFES